MARLMSRIVLGLIALVAVIVNLPFKAQRVISKDAEMGQGGFLANNCDGDLRCSNCERTTNRKS